MEAVSVNNLTFSYGDDTDTALKDVSFRVNKGEILLIIGESGCGKTTLLRHLKPSHTPIGRIIGECDIKLCGKKLSELTEDELSFNVGFVGQNVEESQVTDKVWHEIAFGLESMGCEQSYMQQRVAEMVAFFGLESVYHTRLCELSGGQKQLVNLCAVMVMEPDILILDEPTSQLDPNSSMEFFHMIRKIHDELGTTIIITEHRLEDILSMADKVIVLDDGKVIYEGSPTEVCRYLYAGGMSLFRAMPVAARIFCNIGNEKEVSNYIGRDMPLSVNDGRVFIEKYIENKEKPETLDLEQKNESIKKWEKALQVDEAWFRYEKNSGDVLKALSLDVPKGKITAILGGNGVGKSTLLHVIAGNMKPYIGKIKNTDNLSVGYLPQNPQVMFAEKTVREELALKNVTNDITENIIKYFDLEDCLKKHPFDLSGGQMEKLALAKMVLRDYDVLLLDEPGKGMDYAFKEKLGLYLKEMADNGKTILIVSHDVEFCAKYADCCGLFFDGHIIALKDTRSFFLQNSFYTTAVRRMCKGLFDAVTVEDVLCILGVKDTQRDINEDGKILPQRSIQDNEKNMVSDTTGNEEYATERKEDTNEFSSKKKYSVIVPFLVFLVVMPLTIYIGHGLLHQRKYYFISVMLILEAVGTMFFGFEGSRPKLKDIMTIAVMSAITALSRAMFYMIPAVKPMAALTILSGIGLGGVSGFVVGALSMLVSDIFFGQGPWTPWQMFAMGLLGYLAGLIFNKNKKKLFHVNDSGSKKTKSVFAVSIFGMMSVLVIYGGIMNPASVLMYQENVTWEMLLASFAPGFPIDCIHAASTFIFLWFLTEPMLEKLERVRRK